MPNFVDQMLTKYNQNTKTVAPQEIVDEFLTYFKARYDEQVGRGRKRQISHLATAQTSLSRFKKRLQAPVQFKSALHLTREDMAVLSNEKAQNLHKGSIDLVPIHGDQTVNDCRTLLDSPLLVLRIIALACLTGRRMAEIVLTAHFNPPKEPHARPEYWASIHGMVKQRESDRDRVIEAPLFEHRSRIVLVQNEVKREAKEMGVKTIEDVNMLLGKPVARAMHRFCPSVNHVHAFRKLYVLLCDHYFNERNCSLPRISADYLGHKMVSRNDLPYMTVRVVKNSLGNLTFD